MKKIISIVCLGIFLTCIFCACGKNQTNEKALLRVNDTLYYGTDETGPMGDSGCVEGTIQATVEAGEVPQENGTSNFGCVGNAYTYDSGDGQIMVLMSDDEYHIFNKQDDK